MPKKKFSFDNSMTDIEKISEVEKEEKVSKKEENTTSVNKNLKNDPWAENKKTEYRTTITINTEIEENYLSCKRKFRKQLKTRLTKQNAVEIGMVLLNNLDPEIIQYIRNNFTPEDDIIEEIKKIIKNS